MNKIEEQKNPGPVQKDRTYAEVRELMPDVNRTKGIEFAPGFAEYSAVSPMFEKKLKDKVRLRFSRGKKAPNMSAKHFNKENGETPEGNLDNFRKFREQQGFSEPPNIVHVIGVFHEPPYNFKKSKEAQESEDQDDVKPEYILNAQIQEVSTFSFRDPNLEFDSEKNLVISPNDPEIVENGQLDIRANFVFTRDPNLLMAIKPADCPIVVGYCKDEFGNDLIFIDHSGADACNANLSYQGMRYLRDELGVDMSQVKLTILPGVSKEYYDISNEPERRGNGIADESWKEFIDEKYPDYIVEGILVSDSRYKNMSEKEKELRKAEIRNGQKRHVDIAEATVMQLLQAGASPENMEVILDDSYEAARQGRAHSHRFTMQNDGKNKGRDVVMYQLVGEKQPSDSERLPEVA